MSLMMRFSALPLIALLGACATPPIAKQEIPVSSNPMGATVLVDGAPVGTTPQRIALERNRNYILTLVKEGYEQEDVPIRRRYQSDRVLMSAVQSGVSSALFFKDSGMGVQRGLGSISAQEATGEAYVLEPTTVSVDLRPSGTPRPSAARRVDSDGRSTPVSSAGSGEGSILDASPKTYVAAGALAAAASVRPVEKRWTTSSSSKTSVRSDGSVVTRSSKTSVGVSVDPVGLVNLVDTLFTNGGLR